MVNEVKLPGLNIELAGHLIRLKWHCLRRDGNDPPFSARRLGEGFKEGASMEIDLRRHGENGFVLMHDATLDRETNGRGALGGTSTNELSKLYMRCPDGAISEVRPILFEDLFFLLPTTVHERSLIQIDIKEQANNINDKMIRRFQESISGFEKYCVLSGDDWTAVKLLALGNSELSLGFDTDSLLTPETTSSSGLILDFVDDTLVEAGNAEWIYLRLSVILHAQKLNIDIVELFHKANKKVDTWTFNPEIPDALNILRKIIAAGVDQITTDDSGAVHKMARTLLL